MLKNGKKVIIVRIAAFVFAGITAALFFPRHVIGEEPDFIPRVENISGSLELDMRRIDTRKMWRDFETDTTLFSSIERLRLATDGYIYHPRFIVFRIGGAVGLDQGYYITTGYRNVNPVHVFDEYDINFTLLPEHPYNLDVFARRMVAPLSPINPQSTLATSHGASFRYRQQPLTFYLSAVSQSMETGNSSFDSTQYSASGSYGIGPVRNAASYSHADSLTSQGTEAVRTTSSFNNGISLYKNAVSLDSRIGADRQTQTNPFAPLIETDSTAWVEHLHTDLPLNFSADIQHDYHKDEITTEQMLPTLETTTFNRTNTNSGSITHMLYQSLRSTYSAVESTSQASGGDTESHLQAVAFSYLKNIPIGALNANYSFQSSSFTQTGAAAFTNEKHTTVVPGTFLLVNQANPSTITVLVTDPATQNLVPLSINANNYQVVQFGNTVQITIQSLPAIIVFVPGAPYDFTVSYSLLSIDSETKIRTNTFNLGFTLLDGLFNPFFGLTTSDVDTVFGTVSSRDDITSTTLGYTARISPFSFFTQYTNYRSRFSPYQSLNTWAEYQQFITEDTDVLARLLYNRTERPATQTSSSYSEEITTMNVTGHKAFIHENLNLFAGASYSLRRLTSISSNSYELNTALKWRVGMLDVSVSATRTATVSTGVSGRQTEEEDSYYLTVSRKLF